ncbi:hypothetical protein LSAC_02330 [Levilinea saccharolytica]|nr:hypothetical protein LSAC_02330 [Levilinea saccharolytica]
MGSEAGLRVGIPRLLDGANTEGAADETENLMDVNLQKKCP